MNRRQLARLAMAAVAIAALIAAHGGASLVIAEAGITADTATIVFTSDRDGNSEIYAMNDDGSGVRRLTEHPATDADPAWSPSGRQIAFASNRDGDFEIYVMNDDGSNVRQITFTDGSGVDRHPAWSPDGNEIVFDRPCIPTSGLHLDLYAVNIESGAVRRLTNASCGGSGGGEASWSPSGQIVMQRFVGCCTWDLATLDPDTLVVTRLMADSFHDLFPVWVPGGETIVWARDEGGSFDIWRRPTTGGAATRLTNSPGSDVTPSVSCDGQTVVFASNRDGNNEIFKMSIAGGLQTRVTSHLASDTQPDWRCLQNDAPQLADDSFATDEDVILDIPTPGVLANDVEPDSDGLTLSLSVTPEHGIIDFRSDGSFTYSPDPNFNGIDSFTYEATDPYGESASATVTLEVLPVNDAPVAGDDEGSTSQYQAVAVDVVGNDTDVDGDELMVVAVTQGAHGTVSFSDGIITYDPSPSFKDADSFTYTVSDGAGGLAEATVTIAVIDCGEDGLDTFDGTPAEGAGSQTIDREVEPVVGGEDRDAAAAIHEVNCAAVVTGEKTLES